MIKRSATTIREAALKLVVSAATLLGAVVSPSYAHHSGVMFESDKEVMLTGTVKEFQFANPHSQIQILVPREGGQIDEWNIQTDTPIALDRLGVERTTLQPGEKVTVRAHPLKSGRLGGLLIDLTKADGTVVTIPD